MTLEQFIKITKAISDPQRVRALVSLRNGELCVCQIIELLSLAPSTISKHMSILKEAGLVAARKDSRWVYYRLSETGTSKNEIQKIITLSMAMLELDDQIQSDHKELKKITRERLDILCKKQRNS